MNTHRTARALRPQILFTCALALGIIAIGVQLHAAAAEGYATPSTPWVIIPGGIADTAGKIAYVSSMDDGVEAVDLESGQQIWETKEALHPLAIAGDQLIAQAPRGQGKINTMDIVVIDAPSGKILKHTQPIILPDWVAIDGGIGLSFNCVAAIDGHDMVLSWRAERQFAKGVTFGNGTPPTQEAIAAARKIESGQARVDIETDTATVTLDRVPQNIRLPRPLAYYDVGDKRISLVENPENVAGGIRIVHCLLDARNIQTGRPMWKHEIAGEIVLPDGPPPGSTPSSTAQRVPENMQQPRR